MYCFIVHQLGKYESVLCKYITGEDSQHMDYNQRVLIRQNHARNVQERNKERNSEIKSS